MSRAKATASEPSRALQNNTRNRQKERKKERKKGEGEYLASNESGAVNNSGMKATGEKWAHRQCNRPLVLLPASPSSTDLLKPILVFWHHNNMVLVMFSFNFFTQDVYHEYAILHWSLTLRHISVGCQLLKTAGISSQATSRHRFCQMVGECTW
jgi:hypothetical protein